MTRSDNAGIIGRLASSAAAAALMGLDAAQAQQAVALSATQASGLRGTLGGMGKPMQVGAAARDGIACARMAASGIEVDTELLSPQGGFIRAFVQDESAQLADLSQTILGQDWAVLRTSFKPYACLHGIHPSIDAAIELAPQLDPADVESLRVSVAPGVKKVARFATPATALEEKFYSLVEPVHGERARQIASVLKSFDASGALKTCAHFCKAAKIRYCTHDVGVRPVREPGTAWGAILV